MKLKRFRPHVQHPSFPTVQPGDKSGDSTVKEIVATTDGVVVLRHDGTAYIHTPSGVGEVDFGDGKDGNHE